MNLNSQTTDQHEREKNFLTETEIKNPQESARKSRYPNRDQLIILMLFRHGLRESELCNIKKNSLDLNSSRIWINRLKNGLSTQHPIEGV
jgi:type 1 fimbriae regulatory protein FimB